MQPARVQTVPTRGSEISTSRPSASQVDWAAVQQAHRTGMTALLNCLCVCVFFRRVPGWWPHPQKVLSSDPGSTWWSLQWYLVISWDDPQPFKPLCFVYLWATRKTALIFHHRFFLKEKWENKFQHCSVIRRMIRDLPKRLVRNELTS